jgi:hypothetical protein
LRVRERAEVVQWLECLLAKEEVASSNLVFRSISFALPKSIRVIAIKNVLKDYSRTLINSIILSTFLITIPFVSACQRPTSLTFEQVITHPENYNEKQITVEGFFFNGFEIVCLSQKLVPSTFHAGNVAPAQPLIWVTGDLGKDVYDHLYTQNETPSGYAEHYGKVRVTGTFHYGSKYGHLDSYKYKLDVSSATLLKWSPE